MSDVASISDLQNRLIVSQAQFSEAAIPDALYVEVQQKLDEFLPARRDLFDSYLAAYNGIRMTTASAWFGLRSTLVIPSEAAVRQAEGIITYGNRLAGEIKRVISDAQGERIEREASDYEAALPKQVLDPTEAGLDTFNQEVARREAALADKITGGGVLGLLLGKGQLTMILVGIILAFIALAFIMFAVRALLG